MLHGDKQIAAPAEEPVSLATAKLHLRVDGTDEDALITSQIVAARQEAEAVTGRQLVTASWRYSLDARPRCRAISLPHAPLQSVTEIRYVTPAGATVVLDAAKYVVDSDTEPGRVVAVTDWPETRCGLPGSFVVEYVAGYGAASAVPADIVAGMLLRVGSLFAVRESVVTGTIATPIPQTVEHLYGPYRVWP